MTFNSPVVKRELGGMLESNSDYCYPSPPVSPEEVEYNRFWVPFSESGTNAYITYPPPRLW